MNIESQRTVSAVLPLRQPVSVDEFWAWAGFSTGTLAIVFTDIVGSTCSSVTSGDEKMNAVREAHFDNTRGLIHAHSGWEVKTLGDGFLSAFRTAPAALDFVLALRRNTGHRKVSVRVGIHVGPVRIHDNDVYGLTVNLASRICGMARGPEIWVSNRAKEDIDLERSQNHARLQWRQHPHCELKGFRERQTLWSVALPSEIQFNIVWSGTTRRVPGVPLCHRQNFCIGRRNGNE